MSKNLLYVGLDVHAQTVAIALAEAGGEVRNYGVVSSGLETLEKTMSRIRKAHPESELRVCYEAGPTGFVIARRFAQLGIDCAVVAPSLIPNRSGDRVKTDHRDAIKLARLHRAGELTAVNVPDASDEAMRDLCRARTDAVQDLRRSRAQLKAFLLRNGYRYSGKAAWTEAHRRYLRELVLPHGAQRVVLEDSLRAITTAEERIQRLEDQMHALLESWAMKPVVEALMGLRGFQMVSAMVIVSELGGAWRFDHPRQLMAYLGLVPTEHSSGGSRRQGAISKTGNSHARWLLIEAAHHYRIPPKISKELSKRQEHLSQAIKDCSWKAQTRLHSRMMKLYARGKRPNKVLMRPAGRPLRAALRAVSLAPLECRRRARAGRLRLGDLPADGTTDEAGAQPGERRAVEATTRNPPEQERPRRSRRKIPSQPSRFETAGVGRRSR